LLYNKIGIYYVSFIKSYLIHQDFDSNQEIEMDQKGGANKYPTMLPKEIKSKLNATLPQQKNSL